MSAVSRFPGLIGDRRPRLPRRRRHEEMSVTDALRLVPADTPAFTPHPATVTGPQPALRKATGPMGALGADPYAGQPGPSQAVAAWARETVSAWAQEQPLGRLDAGLRALDFSRLDAARAAHATYAGTVNVEAPPARGGDLIFAALDAEWHGTGPQPVPTFTPRPVPASPSPEAGGGEGLVRALLLAAIWSEVTWCSPDRDTCPLCASAASGWCDLCTDAQALAETLMALYDLVLTRDTDGDAVAAVRASGLDPADLAAHGSPLAAVLDGGAR